MEVSLSLHLESTYSTNGGPVPNVDGRRPRESQVLARLEYARKLEARYAREGESTFRDHLAEKFRRRGWSAYSEVWCDAGAAGRGRIDLIVIPPPTWAYAARITALGIETKLSNHTGTHLSEFFGKLRDKYVPAQVWWPRGQRPSNALPKPTVILYATPTGMILDRAIYDWRDESIR